MCVVFFAKYIFPFKMFSGTKTNACECAGFQGSVSYLISFWREAFSFQHQKLIKKMQVPKLRRGRIFHPHHFLAGNNGLFGIS